MSDSLHVCSAGGGDRNHQGPLQGRCRDGNAGLEGDKGLKAAAAAADCTQQSVNAMVKEVNKENLVEEEMASIQTYQDAQI